MPSNDADSVELFSGSKPKTPGENNRITMKTKLVVVMVFAAALFCAGRTHGQIYIPTNDPPYYGPYNGTLLAGGDELKKHLVKGDTVLRGDSPWSLYAWVWMDEAPKGAVLIAGVGDPGEEYSHYLGVEGAKLFYWGGKDATFSGRAGLAREKWHFVGETLEGKDFKFYATIGHFPAASPAVPEKV